MKNKFKFILKILLLISAISIAQTNKEQKLNNLLKLHKTPVINVDTRVIQIISELYSLGKDFKYFNEFSKGDFMVKKSDNGYDIVINISENEKNNNKTRQDKIKLKIKRSVLTNNTTNNKSGLLEIENINEFVKVL